MLTKKILLFIILAIITIQPALATESIVPGASKECNCQNAAKGSDCYKYCKGAYELDDFTTIAVQVFNWILGITGSLALLAFVYGGVLFLISSGNKETVSKAKQVIIGAIIGLTIVFASYMIVQFVLKALGANTEGVEMSV